MTTPTFDFAKGLPGFDYLQQLMKSAQAAPNPMAAMMGAAPATAVPGMAGWVAPTLSVEEIDKRIQEFKSVLFWLEQNAHGIKATIQALEVQRMTLSTLQQMNVNMSDVAQAFKAPFAAAAAAPAPAPAPVQTPTSSEAAQPDSTKQPKADEAPKAAGVDPMQWWGALSQQFGNIAAAAMKDVAAAQAAMKTAAPAKKSKTSAPRKRSGAAAKNVKVAPASAQKTARKSTVKKPAAKAVRSRK
jgi:hypothetical protein